MIRHTGKITCYHAYQLSPCAGPGLAGFCQAGHGLGTVLRALHMRARGMSCCMDIAIDMNNSACMINMRHGHVHARACRPLCARACGREVVLMNNGVV